MRPVTKLLFVLTAAYFFSTNEAAKILGVSPVAAPSHNFLGKAIFKALAERGHDVTVITCFPEKDPPKTGKWREILLEGFYEAMTKQMQAMNVFNKDDSQFSIFKMYEMVLNMTEKTLAYHKVQDLIKSKEKFDIVIVSQFMNEAMYMLAPHFDAHLVGLSTVGAHSWNNYLVGNPSMPSTHGEVMMQFPLRMNFFQRVANTLFAIVGHLMKNYYLLSCHAQLSRKYISESIDFYEQLYNVSLILLNSHVSITNAQAHVPNMIEIGGFHVKPPKPLPDDIHKFMDDAKDGVIYFSMGSNIKSKDMPKETRDAILGAFSKRKEKIMWKFEDDNLPGKPENLLVRKWFPQQDVLAHKNLKVFWTHGGLLSSIETVYHGVPILATPMFGDQPVNAKRAQDGGYGLILEFNELSEEKINKMLDEIIYSRQYRENVQRRSKIMHDRQRPPIEEAMYWIEYVLRFKGAEHLRVWYVDMPWYQYYMVDVFTFLFGVLLSVGIVVKKLYSSCCGNKKVDVKNKLKMH